MTDGQRALAVFATTRPGLRPGFGHCFVAVGRRAGAEGAGKGAGAEGAGKGAGAEGAGERAGAEGAGNQVSGAPRAFGACAPRAEGAGERTGAGPWVIANRRRFTLTLDVVAAESGDLAAFDRRHGFVVVETTVRRRPGRGDRRDAFRPLGALPVWRLSTCVGLSKAVLGLWAPWVWTPHQLYRHLTEENRHGLHL